MTNGVLHACPNNFRTFEVLIAAKYGGSSVNVQYCQQADKSKFGKVPSFDGANKQQLTGSHAIAKFLAKDSLSATIKCPAASAELVQWLELVDNDLLPSALAWLLPAVSAMPLNKAHFDHAKTETLRLLTMLNTYLESRTFLVRERLSLADLALCCALLPLFQHVLEPDMRKNLVHLTRWFETCVHQPHFLEVLGAVHLCSKADHFDDKKFQAFHNGQQHHQPVVHEAKHPKQEKAAKKEEKKAADTPAKAKEQKKKKEPEHDEEDATDEAMAQEPKQKDPFADMPKGTFNMDEFKRIYSNEDTLTKALPYFWQHFDPAADSVWLCEYKYASELTLGFMSCNLISGMFQRLEKLRKNAFASMCLFGTDNNSTISGVWVWRGQQLAFELCDDWKIDYESYSWKKLDAKAPETRQLVHDYFAWEGDFGGKKFNQGKIFK